MEHSYLRRVNAAAPSMSDRHPAAPTIAELARGAAPTAEQLGRRVDLPGEIREKMESSFGADFSGVRLFESDTVADAGAEAVAQGANIAFAPGKLDFTSTAGQALLGHELSHVVSQARGESAGQGFLNNASLEAQTDRQGMLAARGESAFSGPVTPVGVSAAASASGPMQAKKYEEKASAMLKRNGIDRDVSQLSLTERRVLAQGYDKNNEELALSHGVQLPGANHPFKRKRAIAEHGSRWDNRGERAQRAREVWAQIQGMEMSSQQMLAEAQENWKDSHNGKAHALATGGHRYRYLQTNLPLHDAAEHEAILSAFEDRKDDAGRPVVDLEAMAPFLISDIRKLNALPKINNLGTDNEDEIFQMALDLSRPSIQDADILDLINTEFGRDQSYFVGEGKLTQEEYDQFMTGSQWRADAGSLANAYIQLMTKLDDEDSADSMESNLQANLQGRRQRR